MELYRIEDDALRRVPPDDLVYEECLEEQFLRSEGATFGDVDCCYVSRGESLDEGGRFDVLGVDGDGDAVIVELVREAPDRETLTRALSAAARVRAVSYEHLDDRYREFRNRSTRLTDADDSTSLAAAHAAYFDRSAPLEPSEFNDDQRIVLVAPEFGRDLLRTADLLRDNGLEVVCVEYGAFQDEAGDLQLLTAESVRRPFEQESSDGATELERLQKEFWRGLNERIRRREDTPLHPFTVRADNWVPQRRSLPISGVHYSFSVDTVRDQLKLYLTANAHTEAVFEFLEAHRDRIEAEFGDALDWRPPDGPDKVVLRREGDLGNREAWDEYYEWYLDNAERFHEVFAEVLAEFERS